MSSFESSYKVPSHIPQDLLLIHDLVGRDVPSSSSTLPASDKVKIKAKEDSIESSGDEGFDSEDEVEANLLQEEDEDMDGKTSILPASSESDSDSSSSESEGDDIPSKHTPRDLVLGLDEDDDGPGHSSTVYTKTLNEVVEDDVVIPEISEVDPHESLEQVGEIFSILNNKIVIVRGVISHTADRVVETALDSDTLLVFEDRKVMGFIYETFGPTYQPLYQVRFNEKYPLDTERAQISRPVFHVPQRSKFVFVSKLKQLKGSDASNAHDEEPGQDEIEFSDDEQEAAYKRSKREGRSQSREAFSRQSTPSTSRLRNSGFDDDSFTGHPNPYDEHGPYDMDYGAGPSRPPPIPYNDPYSDPYSDFPAGDLVSGVQTGSLVAILNQQNTESSVAAISHVIPGERPPRGRGRGRGRPNHDRGRGRRDRARGREQHGGGFPRTDRETTLSQNQDSRPLPVQPRNFGFPPFSTPTSPNAWSASSGQGFNHQDFNYAYQNQQYNSIQPHINPRFANQFGFNFSAALNHYGPSQSDGSEPRSWQGNADGDMEQSEG